MFWVPEVSWVSGVSPNINVRNYCIKVENGASNRHDMSLSNNDVNEVTINKSENNWNIWCLLLQKFMYTSAYPNFDIKDTDKRVKIDRGYICSLRIAESMLQFTLFSCHTKIGNFVSCFQLIFIVGILYLMINCCCFLLQLRKWSCQRKIFNINFVFSDYLMTDIFSFKWH